MFAFMVLKNSTDIRIKREYFSMGSRIIEYTPPPYIFMYITSRQPAPRGISWPIRRSVRAVKVRLDFGHFVYGKEQTNKSKLIG